VYQNNIPIVDGYIILVTPRRIRTADSAALADDKSRFGVVQRNSEKVDFCQNEQAKEALADIRPGAAAFTFFRE